MSMFRIGHQTTNVFLGDNERVVHWHVIPVHVWTVETFRQIIRVQNNDDDFSTTAVDKEQRLLSKYTVNVHREELISSNPYDSSLYQMFRLQGVPHGSSHIIIHRVARLARSMIMPNVRPIFVVIMDVVTDMSRQLMELTMEEVDNERLATTIRTLMEDEAIKIVPAAKSSIDKLENVKIKPDDRCSICLEQFADGVDEVARMPCSHAYHTHCIVKWLEYNHLCPLCRFEMRKSIN